VFERLDSNGAAIDALALRNHFISFESNYLHHFTHYMRIAGAGEVDRQHQQLEPPRPLAVEFKQQVEQSSFSVVLR
jgi:hypothetical protein